MVRTKDKKAKGDDAFTKRKQKIGRKKLAPATATKAEVHARTLRIIKPSTDTSSPLGASGHERNRRDGSTTSKDDLDKYRPERSLKENIVGAMHYREVTRSSSFTALHNTVDRYGKEITPLNHMQLLNVSLGAVTDTASEVREKALALFIKILRLFPTMHHDGVKHIFTYIQIALTHASVGVRKAGLKMVGEFLNVWPGAIRKAFAYDIIVSDSKQNRQRMSNTTSHGCNFPVEANVRIGSTPTFVLEQVIDWSTLLACNTNVTLQHHVMPIIAKLLEECLPLCASSANSAGELAHNVKKKNSPISNASRQQLISSEYDPAVILCGDNTSPHAHLFPHGGILSACYLERYYDRFQCKWTSQWKELMELQYKIFRDGISIERIHAVSRCFACVTLALKRVGRLTHDRAKHLKELFIYRVPFSMGELVNMNTVNAKNHDGVQLYKTGKRISLEENTEEPYVDADVGGAICSSIIVTNSVVKHDLSDQNGDYTFEKETNDEGVICEKTSNINMNVKRRRKKKDVANSRNMRIDQDNTMKLCTRAAISNVEAMKGKKTDRVKVINNLNGPERFTSTAKKRNTNDVVRTQNSLVFTSSRCAASAYQAVAEDISWCLVPIATTSERHYKQQVIMSLTNKTNTTKVSKKLKSQKRIRDESDAEEHMEEEKGSHCATDDKHDTSIGNKKFEPKNIIRIVIASGKCKLESCVHLMECTLGLFPQLYAQWTGLLSRGIFTRLSGPLMLNMACVGDGSDITQYTTDAIIRGDSVNIIRTIISSIHLLCRFLRYFDGMTSSGSVAEQRYGFGAVYPYTSIKSPYMLVTEDNKGPIGIQPYKDLGLILHTILPRLLFTLRNYSSGTIAIPNVAKQSAPQMLLPTSNPASKSIAHTTSSSISSISPQQQFVSLGGFDNDYYTRIEKRMKREKEVNEIVSLALREYHRCVTRGHPVITNMIDAVSTNNDVHKQGHYQKNRNVLSLALRPLYGMRISQGCQNGDNRMTIVPGPLVVCSAETRQLANHLFYYFGECAPEILTLETVSVACDDEASEIDVELKKAKAADIWLLKNYKSIACY